MKPKIIKLFFLIIIAIVFFGVVSNKKSSAQNLSRFGDTVSQYAVFEEQLDDIRQELKIPGFSAVVIQEQVVIWSGGFGFADLEKNLPASANTPYGLASVTKPVGAVLILQLVDEGYIDLDAPVSEYGVYVESEGIVTVRHLLTHTSEGVPGTTHTYNGNRYGMLGGVIEAAIGRTFADLLSERILVPLGMSNTAVNPINNWGGTSISTMEEIKRSLGWGQSFKHIPDVYFNLAKPYQLDPDYNIIPGMYQLYHNPAAGLISSVLDLAKFDIALDRGVLLDESAKRAIHTQAVSTVTGRDDLKYGLGWYIQEFEGLQLLWHAGRWSPSTSALYLKVPEKNLTFIILANTDNLTTPFYGIGNGDISQSALTLAFMRHFIFPSQNGYSPPMIEWAADKDWLVHQLSAVREEPAQVFLERELWSMRQVYASVGRMDQVDKLWRVSLEVYPRSTFRRDVFFTNIAGSREAVQPVIPAAAFIFISWGALTWFFLGLVSLVLGMWYFKLKRAKMNLSRISWLLGVIFFGPISLVALWKSAQDGGESTTSNQLQALNASLTTTSVYMFAWTIGITLLLGRGSNPHPLEILGITYLVPFLIGFLVLRVGFWLYQGGRGLGKMVKPGLLAEFITINLAYAVLFPLTIFLSERVLTIIPLPSSPVYWGMLVVIAIICSIVLYPLQYWLAHKGYTLPTDSKLDGRLSPKLPVFRETWFVLLGTLGSMITMLVVTISFLG